MSSGMTLNNQEIFPSDWLGSIDLAGRDLTVEIEKVERAELFNRETNKKTVKLALRFKGQQKGMVCNRTNATSIAAALASVLGKDTDGKSQSTKAERWVGQKITLYPTTCRAFGETQSCIRVRERTSSNGQYAPDNQQSQQSDLATKHGLMKSKWKSRREDRGLSVDADQFRIFVQDATGGLVPAVNALNVLAFSAELIEKCVEQIRTTMPEPA